MRDTLRIIIFTLFTLLRMIVLLYVALLLLQLDYFYTYTFLESISRMIIFYLFYDYTSKLSNDLKRELNW